MQLRIIKKLSVAFVKSFYTNMFQCTAQIYFVTNNRLHFLPLGAPITVNS